MAKVTYADIHREFHKKGVLVHTLANFMIQHGITYHRVTKFHSKEIPSVTGKVRRFTKQLCTGVSMEIGDAMIADMEYTPGVVKKHALDGNCVIIPSLIHYVGAYRFTAFDEIPTITSGRMGYFRCPNLIVSVSLSLWLRHPRIADAIRYEFSLKRRQKEMSVEFLHDIPMAEGILQPEIVKKAMLLDDEIVASLKRVKVLSGEIDDLAVRYE